MTPEEEIKMLLRGIERLRRELTYYDMDKEFFESMDRFKRLNK